MGKRVSLENVPAYIRARCETDPITGCWIWQGAVNGGARGGYGSMRLECLTAGGYGTRVHRIMYLLTVGPVADGLHLDHLCRNLRCCNPVHLEPVTNSVNQYRSPRCGTETECKRGHARTPENTYIETTGRRYCRQCNIDRMRARDAKRRRAVTLELGQGAPIRRDRMTTRIVEMRGGPADGQLMNVDGPTVRFAVETGPPLEWRDTYPGEPAAAVNVRMIELPVMRLDDGRYIVEWSWGEP